jgi:hypothetical protein
VQELQNTILNITATAASAAATTTATTITIMAAAADVNNRFSSLFIYTLT